MSCPLCQEGPGSFVRWMFASHVMQKVEIPDLQIDMESENIRSEVLKLLRPYVLEAGGAIPMWDLLVKRVTVRKEGVLAEPDLEGMADGYELPEQLKESLVLVPLPEEIWERLEAYSQAE